MEFANKIEQLPVNSLRPYPRNARTHSRRQIRAIAKSIEEFGFVNPILVSEDGETIAGHGRVEAAKLLKLETVPVIRLWHLSDAQRRAYILADNKLALQAGWDREILATELEGLVQLGYDVELTGFEVAEIDLTIEAAEDARSDPGLEDQIPEPGPRTVSQAGDIWGLGNHRLICGDARIAETYDRLLGSERADTVFTDPPYNVRMKGNAGGRGQIRHDEFVMASGEMSDVEFTDFLRETLGHAATMSRDGAVQFVFMDWRHLYELQTVAREIYGELLNLCVWNKTNAGMGSLYRSQHELVLVAKVGDAAHRNNVELGRHGRNRSNVWTYQGMTAFRADRAEEYAQHPTIKPVTLIADALRDVTKRGDIVLDPFAGSGSTIIAAEKVGRKARAIELSSMYCDVAVRRWQTFTGKSATLEATGQRFEDVEGQRGSQTPEPVAAAS